jgi:hypothetical protein
MGFETQPGREPSGTPTVQLRFGLVLLEEFVTCPMTRTPLRLRLLNIPMPAPEVRHAG